MSFASGVKQNYDKLLAAVVLLGLVGSLAYLVVSIGRMREMKAEFSRRIDELKPQFPRAEPVDAIAFTNAMDGIAHPRQIDIKTWTKRLIFVPETRIWCVDCKEPIPMEAEHCAHCGAVNPEDLDKTPGYDKDRDGIPDDWEDRYGLNKDDPSDAQLDSDGDGYPNIVEFRAAPQQDLSKPDFAKPQGTNLRDPKSHPSIEDSFIASRIEAVPFPLKFKSVMKLPTEADGQRRHKFGVNYGQKTYFAKLDEIVQGFKVIKYEEKLIRPDPKKPTEDLSELTLEKAGKRIVLVRNKEISYEECRLEITFPLDKVKRPCEIGGSFEVRENTYQVESVDMKQRYIVIRRVSDSKSFTVRELAASQSTESETNEAPSLP